MSQVERQVFDIIKAEAKLAAAGMSYASLAAKMGLTRQAVGHWFRGRGEPNMRQMQEIAEAIGCHWLELVNADTTVLYRPDQIEREKRIRELTGEGLAELDAFLAFKTLKPPI